MLWDNTIRNGVMRTIESRIEDAQARYEDGCEIIEVEAEQKKSSLAEELIRGIVG